METWTLGELRTFYEAHGMDHAGLKKSQMRAGAAKKLKEEVDQEAKAKVEPKVDDHPVEHVEVKESQDTHPEQKVERQMSVCDDEVSEVVRCEKPTKVRKENPWNAYCKQYAKDKGIAYSVAMQEAKASYWEAKSKAKPDTQ